MAGSYIILGIELNAIRNFLEHVDKEARTEIQSVIEINESGDFEGMDDFDNALYHPLMRQELAARAVYHELNALIEHELQKSAHGPWLESTRHKGPKGLDFVNLTAESVRSLKMIQDLPYPQLVTLIEEKYRVKLTELEGAAAFLKMREMVNAFKHRHGLIDFRKREFKDFKFPENHQAEIDHAYEMIDMALAFIKALWQATNREPASVTSLREAI
jgi:hypothetical protein